MKKNYVVNLIGEGVFDSDLPVDRPEPRPVRAGDEGVLLLYGDREGGTVCVAARDEDDAERRLLATFGDGPQIDDLQESVDQRPLSIAYTAGEVPESAFSVLRFDDAARPYLKAEVDVVESLIAPMPAELQATYREGSQPHQVLALLDALLDDAIKWAGYA